jgi:hypothetical protein
MCVSPVSVAVSAIPSYRAEIGTFGGTFREHALLDVWKPGSFQASGTAGVWSFERSVLRW